MQQIARKELWRTTVTARKVTMRENPAASGLAHCQRDIIRQLHAGIQAKDIAEAVVVHTVQALQAQGAVLQVFGPRENKPLISMASGLGELCRSGQPVSGPEQLLAVTGGEEVLVIQQPAADPRLSLPGPEAAVIGTVVLVPLGVQAEWTGFFCLLFARPQELSSAALSFLEAIRRHCTWALSKAWLLAKQQQEFNHLAQQTERLTALGRLAAGVAHELNNPLASILLYSSNMLKKVPPESDLHQGLAVIVQETKRCKTIIQELLELARSKDPKKIVANLNSVLTKVIHLLENEFRRCTVHLHQELDPHMPDLLIDIGQIQQVFVHLLLNALEAVAARGEVSVVSRWDRERQVATITITDNGCGIPPENLGRIYEPFFSTKPRSTGLGLAVSLGFIHDHQGDLQISSEPGRGTSVIVTLPAVAKPVAPLRIDA